jgi:type II secretory pathway pseudopilin PulG
MIRDVRFGLVETVVAILVVGLLIQLLWPALLAARESARKNTCGNNLAVIGLSLHKYADTVGTLPPIAQGKRFEFWIPLYRNEFKESKDRDDLFMQDVTNHSWLQILLPYLDDEQAAQTFEKYGQGPPDSRIYKLHVARLCCPSDEYNREDNLFRGRFARGNYAIDAGSNDICIQPGDPGHPCANGAHLSEDKNTGRQVWYGDGIAGFNKTFKLTEFKNGLRRIVAVEEVRAGICQEDSRGVWTLGMVGASVTHQHGLFGDDGRPNDPWVNSDDIFGCKQTTRVIGENRMVREKMGCAAHISDPRQATARSMHPGGVHCLTLDGSWHFVSDDISPNVWHVLHSRENTQSFDLPWE